MNIIGNFLMSKLILEIKYEVVFVVKFDEDVIGWYELVNLILILIMCDKIMIQQKEICFLDIYVGDDEWVDIKVGEFVVLLKEVFVRIFFIMFQYDDIVWKIGFVVKGVVFRLLD